MTDDLYQEVIIDHSRRPRNLRPLPMATHRAEGHNPLCGDCVTVHLLVRGDRVVEASFEGSGCAISIASASLMTEAVVGKSIQGARELMEAFRAMLVEESCARCELGALEALGGVKNYPMRVKCATLAWHTLNAAIEGNEHA
jgi:nitrogen fixation NifU-like protein